MEKYGKLFPYLSMLPFINYKEHSVSAFASFLPGDNSLSEVAQSLLSAWPLNWLQTPVITIIQLNVFSLYS